MWGNIGAILCIYGKFVTSDVFKESNLSHIIIFFQQEWTAPPFPIHFSVAPETVFPHIGGLYYWRIPINLPPYHKAFLTI
jgi:hypothetical protein